MRVGDQGGGVDQPGDGLAAAQGEVEGGLWQVAVHLVVAGDGLHGVVRQLAGQGFRGQQAVLSGRVLGFRVVEVVQQTGQAPDLLIVAEAFGQGAHDGFGFQGVDIELVGGAGLEQGQRFSAVEHGVLRDLEAKRSAISGPWSRIQQQDVLRLPGNQVWMMYWAQPTPGVTVMAAVGQFRAQAPHSMQASRSRTSALPPCRAKMRCGQTVAHRPQPTHLALS